MDAPNAPSPDVSVLGSVWARLGALFTPWRVHARATVADDAVPLLVRVLAGNPVTSAHILACLNAADATRLRCLHPAVSAVVAAVPWCDLGTQVVDAARWRRCFPAAVGAWLTDRAVEGLLASEPAVAALAGVTVLVLTECAGATDDLLLRLPASLHTLNVSDCSKLTGDASFAHLTALTSLYCSGTEVLSKRADGLPPSLQVLDINSVYELRPGASLAHLSQLRVLRANESKLDTGTLASLPPSLEELHAAHCECLTPEASFAHLTALHKLDISFTAIGDASLATLPPCLVSLNARECRDLTSTATLPHLPALQLLDVSDTAIGDNSLATMPPCLVSLNVRECKKLTSAAVLPPLPALQLLDVSGTSIGDALVASLPDSLIELQLVRCHRVTASARLDHLHSLRILHDSDTELSPAALAMCRERGCIVPAANVLRGHEIIVCSVALLPDGRLASGDYCGTVRLWDATRGGEATAVLEHGGWVVALAALPDGRRLAAGVSADYGKAGAIVVWDTVVAPPARCATINCGSGVCSLAVLHDGRLAAGCHDGGVRLVEVGDGTGAVAAMLEGHTRGVYALAVLPDGTLASGSQDTTVRLWDVGTRECVATLVGHTGSVNVLVVLDNGRLASGSGDFSVRLWDVATRACVGVLEGHTGDVYALAALPDGRLASGSDDKTIRVWDTRPAAGGAGTEGAAAGGGAVHATPVVVLEGHTHAITALHPLPGGRLASGSCDKTVRLWSLPPL